MKKQSLWSWLTLPRVTFPLAISGLGAVLVVSTWVNTMAIFPPDQKTLRFCPVDDSSGAYLIFQEHEHTGALNVNVNGRIIDATRVDVGLDEHWYLDGDEYNVVIVVRPDASVYMFDPSVEGSMRLYSERLKCGRLMVEEFS